MATKCTTLTLENSLYAHSNALIDEFNDILAVHEKSIFEFLEETTIFSKVDFFSSVFNHWVQLIESDELRVPKIEKMIIHTFSFELHKIVKNHPFTINFLKTNPNNETIFAFSYFFSYKFLHYLHEIMPPELLDRFLQSKDNVTYFKSTDDELQNQLLSDLYLFRKNLLVELHSNSEARRSFNQITYESINLANDYIQAN